MDTMTCGCEEDPSWIDKLCFNRGDLFCKGFIISNDYIKLSDELEICYCFN